MKGVELYVEVRRALYVEGLSRREAARRYGIDPRTVAKMLAFSVPPGYRRSRPAEIPLRIEIAQFFSCIREIFAKEESYAQQPIRTGNDLGANLDQHLGLWFDTDWAYLDEAAEPSAGGARAAGGDESDLGG
jgi:transcriptional regulator with XRE-family HTH domain